MPHEPFTEKISLWLDDELDKAEIAELQSHLAQCPSCQRIHQAMRRVDQLLHRATMANPPAQFAAGVESRLARRTSLKPGHIGLGLATLLLGGIFFITVGTMGLFSLGTVLLDAGIVSNCLVALTDSLNNLWSYINLGGLFLETSLLIMRQPLFWGYMIVTLALAWLWIRLIRSIHRPAPVTVDTMILM